MTYFSFTSLSTVGFGDISARSDSERLFCAFMLLLGVSIVTYAISIFTDILGKYQAIDAEIDDYDKLSKFFGLIKHFNNT